MMAESGRGFFERMRWQFLTCVVVTRIAELGYYGCRFSDVDHRLSLRRIPILDGHW